MGNFVIVFIFFLSSISIFANKILNERKPSFFYRKIPLPEDSNIRMVFNYKDNIFAIGIKENKYFLYIIRNNLFKEVYRCNGTIVNYSISFDSSLYFIGKTKIFKFKKDTLIEVNLNYNKFEFSNINKPVMIDSNVFYFTFDKNLYFYQKGIVKKISQINEGVFIKYYIVIGRDVFFLSNSNKLYRIRKDELIFLSDSVGNIWKSENKLYIQKANSIYSYKDTFEIVRRIEYSPKFSKILPLGLENIYLGYDKVSFFLIGENIEKIVDVLDMGFYIKSFFIDNKNSFHVNTNSGYYIFPYLCIKEFEFKYNLTKLKEVLQIKDKFIFVFFRNVFVIKDGKIFELKLDLNKKDIIKKSYFNGKFFYIITKESILIYDIVNFNIIKKIRYDLRGYRSVMLKDTIFIRHSGKKHNFFIDNNSLMLKKSRAHKMVKNCINLTSNIYCVDNFLYMDGKPIKLLSKGFYFKKVKIIESEGGKIFLFLDNYFNLYLYFNNNLGKLKEIEPSSELFFDFDRSVINVKDDEIFIYIHNNLYIYKFAKDVILLKDSLLNCSKVHYSNNKFYILKGNRIFKYSNDSIDNFFHTNEKILDFCIDDRFYVLSHKYFYIMNKNGDIYKELMFANLIDNCKFIDKNCFYNNNSIYFYVKGGIWDFSSLLPFNNSIKKIKRIGDCYYIFTDFDILKIPLKELSYFLVRPEIRIDSIFVDNQYIECNKCVLNLGAGVKDIRFKFEGNSIKSDFDIFTFFNLEKKINAHNMNEINLLNLKSGVYNLRFFIAGNNLFSVNNAALNFRIFIDRYWWEKKGILFLIFLVISISMFFIFLFVYKRRLAVYRIKSEINALSKMQREILKSGNDFIEEIDLKLFYSPYFNAGGDFYDIKKIGSKKFVFIVGDIAGHGLNSSLITAQIKTIFNFYKNNLLDAQFVLSKINDFLIKNYNYYYYSTLVYTIMDLEKYRLYVYSAGHPFPLFFDKSKDSLFYIKKANSFPLGMIPGYKAKGYSLEINEGDILCLYTDGVFSNYSKNKTKVLDESLFLKIVDLYIRKFTDLELLMNNILKNIKKQYPHKKDDETLLFIKVK